MSEPLHFLNPKLIAPDEKQLDKISALSYKLQLKRHQILKEVISDPLGNKQELDEYIYPKKENLFKVNRLYKRLLKKQDIILNPAINKNTGIDKAKQRKKMLQYLSYPIAASILMGLYFFFIHDRESIDKRQSISLSKKEQIVKKSIIIHPNKAEKVILNKEVLSTHKSSNSKTLEADKNKNLKQVQKKKPLYNKAKTSSKILKNEIKTPVSKKAFEKKIPSNEQINSKKKNPLDLDIEKAIHRANNFDLVYEPEVLKEVLKEEDIDNASLDIQAKTKISKQKKDKAIKESPLKNPKLASVIEVEKVYITATEVKSNVKATMEFKKEIFNPKSFISKQTLVHLNKLYIVNQNMKGKAFASHKTADFVNPNRKQSKVRYFLFLYSLKLANYGQLSKMNKAPSKKLLLKLNRLSYILEVNPILSDEYDIRVSIGNKYGKQGKVILKWGQLFYSLSKGQGLSKKELTQHLNTVNRLLKYRKSTLKPYSRLLKKTKSLLLEMKNNPIGSTAKEKLNKLYSVLPIQALSR